MTWSLPSRDCPTVRHITEPMWPVSFPIACILHTRKNKHQKRRIKGLRNSSLAKIFKVPVTLNEITFHLVSAVKSLRHSNAIGRNDTEEMFNAFIFHFQGVLMHH